MPSHGVKSIQPTIHTHLNQYVEYKSQHQSSFKKEEEGIKFTSGDVLSMKPLHCLKQDPGAPFYTSKREIISPPYIQNK
jgi:hypothetical protein